MEDRIRFINFNAAERSVLRAVAVPSAILHERVGRDSYEMQVVGRPWAYDFHGCDDGRRLVRKLLETLYNMGWVLQAAVDISKKKKDKGNLSHSDVADAASSLKKLTEKHRFLRVQASRSTATTL